MPAKEYLQQEVGQILRHESRRIPFEIPPMVSFQSEEMRERFKREARIAAQVDSEYIVDVSDAGVDEATQTPFLVMELLRGEELGDRLKRMGRLPPEEVVTYMQQTAWALDRTHAASIVHRDLKPANLFLTTREDGTPRIKILDFGVAKLVAEGATAAGATRSLGTPLYMAPEQFRANTKLTAAADIHALTLMTYTLLVGEAYWAEEARTAGDVIAFAMVVVHGHPEPPVQRAARRGVTLPPGFDAWFARGAAINPLERFPTASEAIRALRRVGGPAGPAVAPLAMRPPMASEGETAARGGRPAFPSGAMLERATTSTGASAITARPVERSRIPFVAAAAVLGIGVLATAAWFSLRQENAGQESPMQAVGLATSEASPATSEAPSIDTVDEAHSAAVAPSAPSASPSAAPSAPVAVAPTAQVPRGVKPPPKATASPKAPAPAKTPPGRPLLGRD